MRVAKYMLKDEKAMTLVEIIASLLILSIILLAIVPLFFTSGRTIEKSENVIDAAYQAQNDLEEVRWLIGNSPSPVLALEPFLSASLQGYWGEGRLQAGEFAFERSTDRYITKLFISPLDDPPDLIAVRVEVSPRGRPDVTDSQMETIIQWKN